MAWENGARVDGLALSVNERVFFVKRLWRREPLEGGRGRGSGESDEERREGIIVWEGKRKVGSFDWVSGRGNGERERGKGGRGKDLVDGKRAGVEGKWTRVRRGEGEESDAVNCGGREVKVKGEGDVGG